MCVNDDCIFIIRAFTRGPAACLANHCASFWESPSTRALGTIVPGLRWNRWLVRNQTSGKDSLIPSCAFCFFPSRPYCPQSFVWFIILMQNVPSYCPLDLRFENRYVCPTNKRSNIANSIALRYSRLVTLSFPVHFKSKCLIRLKTRPKYIYIYIYISFSLPPRKNHYTNHFINLQRVGIIGIFRVVSKTLLYLEKTNALIHFDDTEFLKIIR